MVKYGMHNKMVELYNVDTIYEGEALPAIKDINLEVSRGEFVTVIGPNGSGKTTLLETVNGLQKVTRGKVIVMGQDMSHNSLKVRKEIGYVPQDFISDPSVPFIVRDVVLMGRYGKIGVMRRPNEEDIKIAEEAMRIIGIEEFADRPIGKLSGGEQQKVMIARAIAQEPKLLLLDEPFSNLDIDSKRRISDILCRLHDENGLTTLMVTHDLLSIPKRCERVIVMSRGRIIAEGEPADTIRKIEDLNVMGWSL
ncbi:MAG: (zinc) transport protein(ABC transporter, ATP-binding protein) [Candidatus Bathyarchaeota archaeon B63]|nr:MAG: (zinc) transport protein(ABC transporter, ATP-binding protein) [Candidatus Bathyarchaeota archaeon B63]